MIVLTGRNVNTLWSKALEVIENCQQEASRNGPVIVASCPIMSVYDKPWERVLFDPARDANPFFHLFEALWMLAGRNDAAFLNKFVKDFGARFAEPDGRIHDAYGYRWRHHFDHDYDDLDQLAIAVDKLRKNPQDRQVVIQMWDANWHDCQEGYANTGANDLLGDWRGRPCNTHIYLRVRDAARTVRHYLNVDGTRRRDWAATTQLDMPNPVLDLTVCCRSNDIIWGAYGANAVHFSFLQEYLAGKIGVGIGKLYQLSNNWHAYEDTLQGYYAKNPVPSRDPYTNGMTPIPIGNNWEAWDDDLAAFMTWAENATDGQWPYFQNVWFNVVAAPMFHTHWIWSTGRQQYALAVLENVMAPDWKLAAENWMRRRIR